MHLIVYVVLCLTIKSVKLKRFIFSNNTWLLLHLFTLFYNDFRSHQCLCCWFHRIYISEVFFVHFLKCTFQRCSYVLETFYELDAPVFLFRLPRPYVWHNASCPLNYDSNANMCVQFNQKQWYNESQATTKLRTLDNLLKVSRGDCQHPTGELRAVSYTHRRSLQKCQAWWDWFTGCEMYQLRHLGCRHFSWVPTVQNAKKA